MCERQINNYNEVVLNYKLSDKVISALRSPEKCSFTPGKLRFFGHRKP